MSKTKRPRHGYPVSYRQLVQDRILRNVELVSYTRPPRVVRRARHCRPLRRSLYERFWLEKQRLSRCGRPQLLRLRQALPALLASSQAFRSRLFDSQVDVHRLNILHLSLGQATAAINLCFDRQAGEAFLVPTIERSTLCRYLRWRRKVI